MRVLCITCAGRGQMAVPRLSLHGSVHNLETCRTCGGEGFYDAAKGPGVDHDLPHGSGIKDAR